MNNILILLLTMTLSMPVFASDPYWTNCDHIETVTGMGDWQPEIKIGSLGDFDGKSYILLSGWLETPTSGYNYAVNFEELANKVQNINLELIAPKGLAGAVIDKVSISERFESPKEIQSIVITIEKDFNWGPEVINCDL